MMNMNKWMVIENVFNATKTVYSDDERFVEGYDGDHSVNFLYFDSEKLADQYIEDQTVSYGENAESGSTWHLLYKGFIEQSEAILLGLSETEMKTLFVLLSDVINNNHLYGTPQNQEVVRVVKKILGLKL